MELVKIANLSKNYGQIKAVDHISFSVLQGEIFGLLGPNGAGKSTTISMLSTLFLPDSGEILFEDVDIIKKPMHIQKVLGIVPQEIALYPSLTGLENLKFWGKAYGLRGKELSSRIDEVSEIIGIKDRLKDKVKSYSGGMKRRLNIGAALLHKPKLLIMDEPTVGIDPQSRNHILETVKKLNDEGMTIIYTSHYMEEVELICDRVSIMDNGKIIASGTKNELLNLLGDSYNIKVEFNKVEQDLIALIEGIEQIKSHNIEEKVIHMEVVGNEVLKNLIDRITGSPFNIESVDIEKPNLENVFLHLTGKALRD